MDADLIALRIKVLGGKQGAAEVKAVNREVAKTGAVSKQASAMATQSSRATSAAFRKQAQMMQSTGRAMTFGITAPLTLAGAMAVKTAASFDKSMAQVRTATGLGGRGMREMEALALKWGAETIFSANESAEAMLELTKSGISPAQTKAGALGATMNLAATEGLELGRTAEIVGAAMNTFGLRANEAGQISDALAGGALASSASVGGLAQSLAQGGQGAAEMSISLEETVGTLAAFAQNGIQASDAGTSLKTFLARLNPFTDKAKKLMARLGLAFFDASGHMLGMRGVAAELRREMGDLSDEERGAAFNVLFGSDARRAANIVFKEGATGLSKYIRATEETGAAEKMAQAQMTGLAGSLENLKGSLETAAVHFGHALAPAVEASATAIGGLADGFSVLPPEVQTTIAVVGGLAALAGPMLWFAGSVAQAVIKIRELRAAEAAGGGIFAGGRKGMLARLGVGLLGTTAAQMGGDALGGDLGNWLSLAGTGAATGYMIGGAPGALVGGAAGGVIAAVQKLTSAEKQLTLQQQRLATSAKSVQEWWGKQRAASRGLIAADERVRTAERRSTSATRQMRQARRHLNAVIAEYGAKSRPAIHAEAQLTMRIDGHRRALNRLRNAEKLRGVALQAYKVQTNITVLAERHRINQLTQLRDRQARLFQLSNKMGPQSERTRELAAKLLTTEGKLAQATKRHGETLADAASKGGQKYARFLQNARQESIRAGGAMQLLNERAKSLEQSFRRLGETNVTMPGLPTPPPLGSTRRPNGSNAAGTNFWRGGPTWIAERGPELVNLPRGSRITAAPATRRLLAAVADPKPSARVAAYGGSDGRKTLLVPVVVKVGRKELTSVVVETQEDAKARL